MLRIGKTSGLQYSKAKGSQTAIEQYKELIELMCGDVADDDPQWDGFQLFVDTDAHRQNIDVLTLGENRELRGVMRPSSTTEGRTGPHGALQIQADNFQETINKTQQQLGATSDDIEQFDLRERITGLEYARDSTLEQRRMEEVREQQEDDVNRLERTKEWFKENWLGASALRESVAGLITSIIGTRTAAIKGAQATKSFAQSARNAIKKLGLWALALVAFVNWILNGCAAALSWLL